MVSDDASAGVSRRTVLRTGAVGAGIVLGVGTASATGRRRGQRRFKSLQKPQRAVSPEDPVARERARGLTVLKVDRADENLYWMAALRNVADVTGVHIHRGGPDENGPHLAELFNTSEPTDEIDGFLDAGAVREGDACTEDDFPAPRDCLTQPGQPSGPPEEVGLEQVLEEIRSGETYVQVHTTDGVMRGQIR